MANLTATCYGRLYGNLDQCDGCIEAPWCRDGALQSGQHVRMRECYGRRFGRLTQCATCAFRGDCRDAGDPKPLTGPTAGSVAGGDAAYEAAQQEPHEPERSDPEVGSRSAEVADVIALVGEAANFKPERMAAICLRLVGLSYAEIGQLCGKTRQAVLKDIDAIEQGNTPLGKLMRRHWRQRLPMTEKLCAELTLRLRASERPFHTLPRGTQRAVLAAAVEGERLRGPGRMTGPGGACAIVAERYGLSSWAAVYWRLFRA